MILINCIRCVPVWLLLTLIFVNNLWSFSYLDLKVYQGIHIIIIAFFCISIVKKSRTSLWQSNVKKHVILIMLLPLLSVYSCYFLHGQSPVLSLIIYRMHLGWLLFFVLWYYDVEESVLLKAFVFMGIVFGLISVLQQFSYPLAPFGTRTVGSDFSQNFDGGVEKRLGLYRFGIDGFNFAAMALLFCVAKKIKISMFFVLVMIIGLIATGTRQIIFGFLFAFCYYFLFLNHSKYRYVLLGLLIAFFVLISFGFFDIIGGLESFRMDIKDT